MGNNVSSPTEASHQPSPSCHVPAHPRSGHFLHLWLCAEASHKPPLLPTVCPRTHAVVSLCTCGCVLRPHTSPHCCLQSATAPTLWSASAPVAIRLALVELLCAEFEGSVSKEETAAANDLAAALRKAVPMIRIEGASPLPAPA